MADNLVMEYAGKLGDRLKNEGPLAVEDVVAWLTEEEVPLDKQGLVLGQGAKRGAHKWHREGDSLIPGPVAARPVVPTVRGKLVPSLEDAQTQPTLKAQFQGLMESVGIDENQARAAANFCFGSFEMEDPAQIWQALRECLQIGQPGMKKQIWRLWTKTIHVDPPEAVAQQVATWGQNKPTLMATAGRKWFVIDGQVVPTTPDDPDGMTMADALRLQSIQRGNNAKDDQTGGSMVTTLLQQQGETERERMKLEASKNTRSEGESLVATLITQQGEMTRSLLLKPPDTSFEGRIEAQRREFETRMEAQNQRFMDLMASQGERHQHMLEMVQTQNTHSLELVRLAMDGNNNRPSVIEQIEAVLTSGLIDRLKPAPTPVSMITGPNGQMTLDVYKAIKEMEFKAEALSLGKQAIPDLIKMGTDIAQATRALAASRGDTIEDAGHEITGAQGRQTYLHTNCGRCGQSISYPAGGEFLICPNCRAPLTADGRLMVPQGPPAEVDELEPIKVVTQETPDFVPDQAPASRIEDEGLSPLIFGSYALVPVPSPAPEEPAAPEEPGPELAPVLASAA